MTKHKHTGDGQPSPVSPYRRCLRLAVALSILAAFLYLAPNLERLPGLGQRIQVLRESGINVGAWYYDDVEQYFEAEEYVRKKLGKRDRFH